MKHADKLASAGALTAALISLTCCLPFSIPAALGLAGLSIFAGANQAWLIGASFLLLGIGVIQLRRQPACQRRSSTGIVLLGVAAALVAAVMLLPQSIAGFLADRISTGVPGAPALTELDPASFAELKAEFNAAAGKVRIIALLSPT